MLFHRDFLAYTGGHGKVWDYFRHALALGLDARVYLTARSLRDGSNPWMSMPERIIREWTPEAADLLFVAGMDWQALPATPRLPPVANLISHVRHAVDDPALPLRGFLSRRAHRICLSQPIADAILATGEVNGPVSVTPAAIDLPCMTPAPLDQRVPKVLILATKQRSIGVDLHDALAHLGIGSRLLLDDIPIDAYFAALAGASLVVCLPHATEGFYLPALEAMGLGTPVVVPDCVGNREYAVDGVNCLMPALALPELLAATTRLWNDRALSWRLAQEGIITASRYTQNRERAAFASILESLI